MAEVARLIADWDVSLPTPRLGREIQRIVRRLAEHEDPYGDAKSRSNQAMLRLAPRLREAVKSSSEPIRTALLLAARANCIDFGPGNFDVDRLEGLLLSPEAPPFDRFDGPAFFERLDSARRIVLLCDNAGEIVADMILVEALGAERMTAVVRGRPVLNDATGTDAEAIGLTRLCPVLDTEDDTPGWPLRPSVALRKLVEAADLILCKGQGNFETLEGSDDRHFFLLKAKCPPVAACLGVKHQAVVLAQAEGLAPSPSST